LQINKNVLRRVPAKLRELYTLIETDFHPLTACQSIAPLVSSLAEDADYAPYLAGLRDVVLSRLLQSLSKLYSSIQIEHVLDLVGAFKGTSWETSEQELEKFLMATCKRGELSVSVDHVAKAVTFQEDAFDKPTPLTEITNLQVGNGNVTDSPLSRLATALQNTAYYLDPSLAEAARQAKAEAFAQALAQAEEERKAIQHRHAIIARRRQKLEEINTRREKEEALAKAEKARLAAEEAAKREAELYAQRERERIQKQIDAVKAEEAKKLADTLKARGGLKVDVEVGARAPLCRFSFTFWLIR
jgi:translation initiation factor 3 subunit A